VKLAGMESRVSKEYLQDIVSCRITIINIFYIIMNARKNRHEKVPLYLSFLYQGMKYGQGWVNISIYSRYLLV